MYDATDDPYTYENSTVLINKLDLRDQGELDDFWRAPTPPDAALFDAFRRVLAARCLIPGSFFNEAGLRLAVGAAIERLEATYARAARGVARPPAGIETPITAAVSMR